MEDLVINEAVAIAIWHTSRRERKTLSRVSEKENKEVKTLERGEAERWRIEKEEGNKK